MTASELIEVLEKAPADAEVQIERNTWDENVAKAVFMGMDKIMLCAEKGVYEADEPI